MSLARSLSVLILAATLTGPRSEEGTPILKGAEVDQFDLVGIGKESITIQGDEVRLSGRPTGYFATKGDYQDFVLTFDFRYERPADLAADARFRGNSGVLVHISRPHKVWPECFEVQLAQADPCALFALGAGKCRFDTDTDAQKKAIKAVGEWNRVEVSSRDGTFLATLNGVEVTRGKVIDAEKGPIGWQSQGAPIRFRNLRIKSFD